MFSPQRVFALVSIVALLLVGCSGGGGGGEGRTRQTALRLVHASLDGAPVALYVDNSQEILFIQSARFAQSTEYVPAEAGSVTLNIERANTPGSLVRSLPVTLENDTEYTVLLYGEVDSSGLETILLEDIVQQPEQGMTYVQFVNAYEGGGSVTLTIGGRTLGPLAKGSSSGYVQVPAGVQSYSVSTSTVGSFGEGSTELSNRGELTFVATGSRELGVSFVPIYKDLD